MKRSLLLFSSISIAIAICLGAFGAHYLNNILLPSILASFKTGVMYQLILSVALFAFANSKLAQIKHFSQSARFIVWGMVLFSGSIYLLTLKNIFTSLHFLSMAGIITPLGGLLLIVGWLKMAYHSYKLSA